MVYPGPAKNNNRTRHAHTWCDRLVRKPFLFFSIFFFSFNIDVYNNERTHVYAAWQAVSGLITVREEYRVSYNVYEEHVSYVLRSIVSDKCNKPALLYGRPARRPRIRREQSLSASARSARFSWFLIRSAVPDDFDYRRRYTFFFFFPYECGENSLGFTSEQNRCNDRIAGPRSSSKRVLFPMVFVIINSE